MPAVFFSKQVSKFYCQDLNVVKTRFSSKIESFRLSTKQLWLKRRVAGQCKRWLSTISSVRPVSDRFSQGPTDARHILDECLAVFSNQPRVEWLKVAADGPNARYEYGRTSYLFSNQL